MRNILIVVTILIVGLIANTVVNTMISNKSYENSTVTNVNADEVTDSYWNVYSEQFVKSCVEAGSSNAYCTCTINTLESRYGRSKVVEVSIKYAQDKVIPQELFDASASCGGR